MMLVVYFHSSFPVDNFPILYFGKLIGDIGVDIFLLMSGFGIYYSVKKYSSCKMFVAQRCKRILPAFLLVTILWFALQDLILGDFVTIQFLLDITTLSFWIDGKLVTWYLTFLMLLYLLTPVFIRYWEKYRYLDVMLIIAFTTIAVLIRLTELSNLVGHLLIILFRIPVYIFGLSIGRRMEEKSVIHIHIPAIVIFACVQ